MISEITGDFRGEIIAGKKSTQGTQNIFRILFGMTGMLLSIAGMVIIIDYNAGIMFRLAGLLCSLLLPVFVSST